MSCTNPLYAFTTGAINPETGKKSIHILSRSKCSSYEDLVAKFGVEHVLMLPCGKCSSCIEDRSRSWALRCVLESSLYDNNSFITLTYNEKCNPGYLCKKDVQKFFKRLRKLHPDIDIRYYGCGEYGPKTLRPHYHFIVFNYFPSDAKFSNFAKYGGIFYTSKELQDLWPFGFVSLGDVTFESCAYVARYCNKKLKDAPSNKKEFSMMSLKPGIGAAYFESHIDMIKKYDRLFGNFGSLKEMKPCKYFDKLLERVDPFFFQELKGKRISKSNLYQISNMLDHGFECLQDSFNYSAEIKKTKFDRLKRKEI